MTYLPYVVLAVVLIGFAMFSSRARRRQAAAQAQLADDITVGSEVMTTSGLYGTVVARNDDETVRLSIAPGVEVRWALAALRDAASLPERYAGPIDAGPIDAGPIDAGHIDAAGGEEPRQDQDQA